MTRPFRTPIVFPDDSELASADAVHNGGTGLLRLVPEATGVAATDTAAIASAISTAAASPFYAGIALRKTATAYEINATVTVSANGLAVTSVGGRAQLNRSGSGFGAVLEVTGDDVVLSHFDITGTAASATAGDYGINAQGTTRLTIDDVGVSGQGGDGIGLDTTPNTFAVVRGCKVTGVYGHGITATAGSTDCSVLDNVVHDTSTGGYGMVLGYTSADSTRFTVRGNRVESAGATGAIQCNRLVDSTIAGNIAKDVNSGFVFVDCEDSTITGNVANDTTPNAAQSAAFYFDTRRCTISGNSTDAITGSADGFRFISGSTDNLVVGNRTDSAGREGFMVEGARNTFIGNHAEGAANRGFRVRADDNVLLSNRVEGNGVGGIKLENSCDGVAVLNNDVSNIAAAGSSPPGLHLDATPTNYRVAFNNVHDVGAGTPVSNSASGGLAILNLTGATTKGTYTTTNGTTDRSFDADTVAVTELADVVHTLIGDLRTLGIVS